MASIKVSYGEIEGERVASVTIDRAEKMNALNSRIVRELKSAFDSLYKDTLLRAVILESSGDKAWVGGADINEMASFSSSLKAQDFIKRLHLAMLSVRNLHVPVIAKVDGFCLGAGMELAAACDLRVSSLSAQFGMPEVQVGLPSVIEATLLPGLMGRGRATRLMLTGELIHARRAYEWGFVEEVVSNEQLVTAVHNVAARICQAGHYAVSAQKTLLRHWEQVPPDVAAEDSIETFASAFDRDEPITRLSQFRSRRYQS